jgi:putative membrane protein
MKNSVISSIVVAALAAVLTLPAEALGTGSAATEASGANRAGGSSLAAADQHFVHDAAIGGMEEVELGKIAQQKGSTDQVKQFGARMVQDHTKANDELKQLAASKGVQTPDSLDKHHQQVVDKMNKLTGADFDKAYMKEMVSDHKKDISDFKKASQKVKDSDIRGFASKTLPTLQEHLVMAQSAEQAAKTQSK